MCLCTVSGQSTYFHQERYLTGPDIGTDSKNISDVGDIERQSMTLMIILIIL